ncbi:MAG: glycolate oxidase subunit GlcE [Gammaproteobacteria bacterium]|nr:glycolate oxidase subunit GlcE [Gammaproteobacteria bacterium]
MEAAIADKTALNIIGGNSKALYGRLPQGEALNVAGHQGITSYEATELVISARAGTSLEEIEYVLNKNNQMLAFEPPHFGPGATIGGTIACNFSGPRRPYNGAARDFLLGTKIINGKAEALRFGGEVMKNVAGYDVSRLMCGSMGTLGVLLEVSLKVLPKPINEITLVQETDATQAIRLMNQWAGMPLPISATAWVDGQLYVRLSGTGNGIKAASKTIGADNLDEADEFWRQLREQQLSFFNTDKTLWRLSVPPTSDILPLDGPCLIEWGGGLRWLLSDAPADEIFSAAASAGGHAVLFAGGDRSQQVFQSLDAGLQLLHNNLKHSFDPHGILNPGRMYQDF